MTRSELTPEELLDACWKTIDQLQVVQSHIFIDLGQTAQEREEIANILTDTFYTTGFMRVSKERVQYQLDREDLFMLVQGYIRQEKKESVLHRLEIIQAKRPNHERDAVQRKNRDTRSDDTTASLDPVSEVSTTISLRTRRNGKRIGIRRDTRRTAKCDDRAMPTGDVSA